MAFPKDLHLPILSNLKPGELYHCLFVSKAFRTLTVTVWDKSYKLITGSYVCYCVSHDYIDLSIWAMNIGFKASIDAACFASSKGYLELIKIMFQNNLSLRSLRSPRAPEMIIQVAAQQGHWKILEWISENITTLPSSTVEYAAWSCDYDTLAWLFTEELEFLPKHTYPAALYGRIDILDLIHNDIGCEIDKGTWENAAYGAKIQVLDWLLEHTDDRDNLIVAACIGARIGSIQVLTWVDQHIEIYCVDALVEQAILGEQLEMLKYIITTYPKCHLTTDTALMAIESGRIGICQYLYDNHCSYDERAFNSAVASGNLETCQWLYDINCPYDSDLAQMTRSLSVKTWIRSKDFQIDEVDDSYLSDNDSDDSCG